jgi:hypothetical protein
MFRMLDALIKCLRRVSVGMNLARPFKAGESSITYLRRVATAETGAQFNRRYATRHTMRLVPAFKGRAKLIPTLRDEEP